MSALPEISGFRPSGSSNGVCTIRINPADFTDSSPFRLETETKSVYVPNRKAINIDIVALFPIAVRLPETAYRVYMYLLSRLNENRYPVRARQAEIKLAVNVKQERWIAFALHRLEQTGLIFKAESVYSPGSRSLYSYVINPVFAWVGDQRDYLDLSGIDPE